MQPIRHTPTPVAPLRMPHVPMPTQPCTHARVQRLLEKVRIVPWEADVKTNQFTYVGPQAEVLFGYPVEQWFTQDFWIKHIHPDDREDAINTCLQAASRQSDYSFDYRMITASNQIVHILDFVSVSRDEMGTPTLLSGYLVDITERKRAEALHLGLRNVLETLAMGASLEAVLEKLVGVVETHSSGTIGSVLLLDDQGCFISSTAPRLPKPYSQSIIGQSIGPVAGSCGTAAFRKDVVIVEDIYTDPLWKDYFQFAGSFGLRACWSVPIIDNLNRVLGTFAMYHGEVRRPSFAELEAMRVTAQIAAVIIEHSRIRDSLTETVSLLNATLESTADGILVVDTNGKIINCNKKFQELWRIPDEIMASRDDTRALNFVLDQIQDPEKFLARVQELYQAPSEESFDLIEFKDGRIFERYSKSQKFGENLSGRVCSFRDITESRRSEMAAKAADRAKAHFLANISHEIRTPLSAMLGFSELLTSPNLSQEDIQNWVRKININGAHLLEIVDEILECSKTEFGKVDIELSQVDVQRLLEDVYSLFQEKVRQKGITLNFEIQNAIPYYIRSDFRRLKQILINLLGNAIKFTDQGSVTLKVSHDSIQHRLNFSIVDTGVGIAADQIGNLFLPFAQADSSYTRRHAGTGLGLALARQLARLLHGDVQLDMTSQGKGSTFSAYVGTGLSFKDDVLYFDHLSTSNNFSSRALPGELPSLKGARVLLVEDAYDNQLLVTRFLQLAGADVDVADNGQEGVNKALEGSYDVVLMDIQMPKMDGYQAVAALRSRDYSKAVISLTAHAMMQERARALEAGFTDFLTKPVNRQQLITLVYRHWKHPQVH